MKRKITEIDAYRRIRSEQEQANGINAISECLKRRGFENGWVWLCREKGLIEAFPGKNYQDSVRFYVYFSEKTAEKNTEVFALRKYGTSKLICERTSFFRTTDWEKLIENSFLQKYNEHLQLSERILQSGRIAVSAADYCGNKRPTRRAIKIIARKLEETGFALRGIDFEKQRIVLDLPE